MTNDYACLDTSFLVTALIYEESGPLTYEAMRRLEELTAHAMLVAPSFAWAEFGSTLRKKVRQGMQPRIAEETWATFLTLPILYVDSLALRDRSWAIASQYRLPTLYDASFLACSELAMEQGAGSVEFWTADLRLVHQLGSAPPAYLRLIGSEESNLPSPS